MRLDKKYFVWLLPILWMGIIFLFSSQPYDRQDIKPVMNKIIDLSFMERYVSWISFTYANSEVSVQAIGIDRFIEFFIRKGAHFTVFFILMILFYIALSRTNRLKLKANLIVSLLLSIAYAVMDEFHQGFTPNRTPYIGDVVIDGSGACVAGILIYIILKRKRKVHDY